MTERLCPTHHAPAARIHAGEPFKATKHTDASQLIDGGMIPLHQVSDVGGAVALPAPTPGATLTPAAIAVLIPCTALMAPDVLGDLSKALRQEAPTGEALPPASALARALDGQPSDSLQPAALEEHRQHGDATFSAFVAMSNSTLDVSEMHSGDRINSMFRMEDKAISSGQRSIDAANTRVGGAAAAFATSGMVGIIGVRQAGEGITTQTKSIEKNALGGQKHAHIDASLKSASAENSVLPSNAKRAKRDIAGGGAESRNPAMSPGMDSESPRAGNQVIAADKKTLPNHMRGVLAEASDEHANMAAEMAAKNNLEMTKGQRKIMIGNAITAQAGSTGQLAMAAGEAAAAKDEARKICDEADQAIENSAMSVQNDARNQSDAARRKILETLEAMNAKQANGGGMLA